MVIDVNRSHIKVELFGKTATLPGEMFFPEGDKLGFALFRVQARYWDAPADKEPITDAEFSSLVDDIRENFAKGGHILEVE